MKIVIEIDDQKYKWIVDNPQTYTDDLCEAIRNGTPLPKNHGDLIDRTALSDNIKNRLIQTALNNTETIVPMSKACVDIVDNRIDIWIDEVKTIIEGSESE